MPFERRAATAVTRFGLGLAAVGRPDYITLGRREDLPAERTADAMRERAHEVLDAAYARGVRYFDAARSYGRSEEFLAQWLRGRPEIRNVVIGSKWGYTYTADWHIDAPVHEVKDHSPAAFERQRAETREILGDRLDLYQIHSVTPDSPALTDRALQDRLAGLAAEGVGIGLTTSGPEQSAALRAGLTVVVDGIPLFSSFQATYNVLEPSAAAALTEVHNAGRAVIVKEVLANGRLAHQDYRSSVLARLGKETGASPDALALAAVLEKPWADIVLSGAATTGQLAANLAAGAVRLDPGHLEQLAALAEPPAEYWRHRAALPWS